MTSTMPGRQILDQIDREQQALTAIWDRLAETKEVQGMDTEAVANVRNYVSTARDSLRTAREVMAQSINNG